MGRLATEARVAPSPCPVLLVPAGPMLPTEYGKRWVDEIWTALDRHSNTIRDIAKLAEIERAGWDERERLLRDAGVPTAVTNGLSQYAMSHLLDHVDGKTSFTMPTTVALALTTAAPTSTSTGATITEAAYTGYAEVAIAAAGFNAATAATPSVQTNNGAITFGNCTAGSSVLAGYVIKDSSTVGAGNCLWYGTLTTVTINTTQTPPTIANGALSLQLNDT